MNTCIYRGTRTILFTGAFLSALALPAFLPAQNAGGAGGNGDAPSPRVGAVPAWTKELGDVVEGQPFLQAESAVVACAGGSIKSFYMTGSSLWDFDPQDEVSPHIARSMEGAAYVCDGAGVFKAVNRVGRELWRVNIGRTLDFAPVVGWDGRVFIPSGSQILCRTAAGSSLWSRDLGSPVASAPVLDHAGSLALVLENRDFVRLSQFGAEERVKLDAPPGLVVSLKYGAEDSYILLYPSGRTEKIRFNDRAPRGSKLSRESFPPLPAAPAAAAGRGDHFAVTLKDGRVRLLDGKGSVLWTGDSHESAAEKGSANIESGSAAMVFDERGIYSITKRGAAGFAPDGRRRFVLKIDEASAVPALSDEGLLYVCGKDKLLWVYKLDNKARTVPRSRFYGPKPEGSYGLGDPPPSPWATDPRRYSDDQQDYMYERILAAVNSGQLGEDEPYYTAYLHEMIGFFLNDPHYSRVRPAVKPPRRVALIRLLGKTGSRDTVPFLWKIFDRDAEPAIKAACAEAIGSIGVDPDGSTFVSYNFLLAANNPNRDPQLLMSATSSVAALCRFSGPPLSGEGILLLRYFSNLSWPPNSIKAQIRNEVDALYREGLDKVVE